MADLAVPPGATELEAHPKGGWRCYQPGCMSAATVSGEMACTACGDFADEQLAIAAEATAEILALEVDAQTARAAQTAASLPDEDPVEPVDDPDDDAETAAAKEAARSAARAARDEARAAAWRAATEDLDRALERIGEATKRRSLAEAAARGLDQPHTHPRYWCAQHRPEA